MAIEAPRPVFFYDLHSPYAYLAAERIPALLPEAELVPVLAGAIFKAAGRASWALSDEREAGMREVETRARARGLPPIHWPEPWPGNSLRAMRAAVYAAEAGLGARFAREAFRIHFAEGRSLERAENIAAAAQRAGIDAEATLAACEDVAVKAKLRANTDRALARGVFGVPTVVVGGDVFWGDDGLGEAAAVAPAGLDARR
ncbi:MAG: DsbA family protein [Gaiellaceae bacterium MAG52_C11]|nr:DsbA family protein [Candidatus Gaiellasilicea maunaloa]